VADERLTSAERREQARAERRRKEADEAARASRRRLTSIVVGLVITAFVTWVLWLAFSGGPGDIETPQVVDPAAASDAREAAGCEPMPVDLSGTATHFAPAEAPPADALYTLRPTASGPHFERPSSPGVYRNGMDERGSTHAMEHGAVVLWWDPDVAPSGSVDEITDLAELLNANGFGNPRTGAGIFAAAFEGAFTSGKPIALRAWGAALDCDTWDRVVAEAFVVDHYGSHGISPERTLGPYPEDVLIFGPGAEQTESPDGGLGVVPPEDGGGDGEGMEVDGSDPTEEPTDEATGDATE